MSLIPADLPAEYQLSFYLGEIVRNDSGAENETKMLWRRLSEAGLGDGSEMQRDFGRVIRQVRKMLNHETIPPEFSSIALGAVEATQHARLKRSSLVHEILIQPPWANGRVREVFGNRRTLTIEEIAGYANELRTCMWRMRGLWIIAPAWVGGPDDEHEDHADLVSWTRVAMGHIADNAFQVIGTAGPSPEPPGGYPSTPNAMSRG